MWTDIKLKELKQMILGSDHLENATLAQRLLGLAKRNLEVLQSPCSLAGNLLPFLVDLLVGPLLRLQEVQLQSAHRLTARSKGKTNEIYTPFDQTKPALKHHEH